ncbi:hypothetical protein BU251_04340 [Candidatus Velamenicoccus archaeovorus]|uniref:Class I SAM-dependent methyltransferase n=1 Tax=Velamenicoccus archaeovorus TaxID=1930593 RepID=A0A410P491_VELA1|nr:class I SAM-dependent methyltransferase [Candidatus Velamenicoccus archaeovorus]QAT17017.1 hypothetical protein BU251_04340 [Candidatus Velamenicoccus archaeovorus]
MVYIRCDLCQSDRYITIEAMGRFRHPVTNVVCCQCGLVFQNPRLENGELNSFYANHFSEDLYGLIGADLMSVIDGHRFNYIRNYIKENFSEYDPRRMKILEIGCGHGGLMKLLEKDGYCVEGIEPSISLCKSSCDKGLKVYNCFLEDFVSRHRFDLVLAFHVIEHTSSAVTFMKKINSLLDDKGRVVIETPDVWHLYGDPHTGRDYLFRKDHTFTFSENSLGFLASLTGFNSRPIKRLTPRHIWFEFNREESTQRQTPLLQDRYEDIVCHVFNYRAHFSWRQRILTTERLIILQSLILKLVGQKGLKNIKAFLRKIGIYRLIEKIRS